MIESYTCPRCNREFDWDDRSDETLVFCPNCHQELRPPGPTFPKGSIIGDYEVEERIGIGGMGEVYLAKQLSMAGRRVALKVLQSDLVEDESYLQRFYREVRTLALIEHPSVVKAIEVGFDGSTHYFAMSYIPGMDLKHRLDDGEIFPELEALRIILAIACALDYVWQRHKLLHRDIKPANIIVTPDGDVKLMDLGISKQMSVPDVNLTMVGMMVGSPLYVSPEQAKAEKDLDFRGDMYSLGATFFHMLTGRPPYNHESAMAIIASHLSDPVPDPRELRSDISEYSSQIFARMMMKRREERYQSWDHAIEDIEFAYSELSGEPLEDRDDSPNLVKSAKAERLDPETPTSAALPSTSAKIRKYRPRHLNYLRISALLLLLILSMLGFYAVIRKGVREKRLKQTESLYRQAYADFRRFEQNPSRSNFNDAYLKLTSVCQLAQRRRHNLIMEQAELDLESLKATALEIISSRRHAQMQREMEQLKRRSYELEKQDEYGKALDVWRSYSGEFQDEFSDETRRQIYYLEKKQRDAAQGF